MAKVPLPERGQPLDVPYIYNLVNTVNDLSNQVSSATYKYSTINNENVKTSDTRIFAQSKSVANNSTVSAGNEVSFSISFEGDFKFVPIVSATPVNIGGTPAGQNLSVVVTSVTTSGVTGVVRFNASGDLTVSVHVIAIGIPN